MIRVLDLMPSTLTRPVCTSLISLATVHSRRCVSYGPIDKAGSTRKCGIASVSVYTFRSVRLVLSRRESQWRLGVGA